MSFYILNPVNMKRLPAVIRCYHHYSRPVSSRALCTGRGDGDDNTTDKALQTASTNTKLEQEKLSEERKAAAKAKLQKLLSSFTAQKPELGSEVKLFVPRLNVPSTIVPRATTAQKTLSRDDKDLVITKTDRKILREDRKVAAKAKLQNLLSSFTVQKPEPGSEVKNFVGRRQVPKPKTPEATLRADFGEVDKRMAEAVLEVAAEVGGGPRVESELLKSLKLWQKGGDTEGAAAANVKDLLAGISVRQSSSHEQGRSRLANAAPAVFSSRFKRSHQPLTSLLTAEPLGIFTPIDPSDEQPQISEVLNLPTWDALVAKELEKSVASVPTNHFQELIQWTKEGKVWTFPLDNQVGLEEEKMVSFHEHIFLERHLEPWCPRGGPIRHFMELVSIGLSNNPYITVERKKNILKWYQDFFEDKIDLLKEIGAMPADGATDVTDDVSAI